MEEEDILLKWWKPVTAVALALVFTSFGIEIFNSSSLEENSRVSEMYSSFLESEDTAPEGLEGTSYEKLASLIAVQRKLKDGDTEAALGSLNSSVAGNFASVSAATTPSAEVSPEGLLLELEALLYARALVASGSIDQGRGVLFGLARGADFINLEALSVLSNLANSQEELDQISTVVSELEEVRPGLKSSLQTF